MDQGDTTKRLFVRASSNRGVRLLQINHLDYQIGVAYAITQLNKQFAAGNKKTLFGVYFVFIDSAYYSGVMDFMRGVYDVCHIIGFTVKTKGQCRTYKPTD